MTLGGRTALLALIAAAACRKASPERAAAAEVAADPVQRDAQVLGRQLFELVDRAADYRSSHRGVYPLSVAQMGIDSLTPVTARRLTGGRGPLSVTVEFRKGSGHAIASCSGGAELLESAALGNGRVAATCRTPAGETQPLEIDTRTPSK